MKEIKVVSKWRTISCSQIGRPSIIKKSVLPKLIYRFNIIPIKIPAEYFVEIDKLERQRTLNFEEKVRGFTVPNLKTYKATVIKTE